MASIQIEISKILNAKFGEEVRSAICDGLQKINDDNNSYNQLKKDVESAAEQAMNARDSVSDTLRKSEELSTVFDEKAKTAQALIDSLNATCERGETLKPDLNSRIDDATKSIGNLKNENNVADSNIKSLKTENGSANDLLESLNTAIQTISGLMEQLESELSDVEEKAEHVNAMVEQIDVITDFIDGFSILSDEDLQTMLDETLRR